MDLYVNRSYYLIEGEREYEQYGEIPRNSYPHALFDAKYDRGAGGQRNRSRVVADIFGLRSYNWSNILLIP